MRTLSLYTLASQNGGAILSPRFNDVEQLRENHTKGQFALACRTPRCEPSHERTQRCFPVGALADPVGNTCCILGPLRGLEANA